MANFGAGDVQALMADFGVPVIHSGTSTLGLVDRSDEEILQAEGTGAGQIGRFTVVLIQTGTLPGLAPKQALTVDGEAFMVASLRVLEDSELTRLVVSKS